jgi:hypothetical protein
MLPSQWPKQIQFKRLPGQNTYNYPLHVSLHPPPLDPNIINKTLHLAIKPCFIHYHSLGMNLSISACMPALMPHALLCSLMLPCVLFCFSQSRHFVSSARCTSNAASSQVFVVFPSQLPTRHCYEAHRRMQAAVVPAARPVSALRFFASVGVPCILHSDVS